MRHKVADGVILDTDNATQEWPELRDWDGSNMRGRSSHDGNRSQTLYRSKKGRYYLEYRSCWQGELPHASLLDRVDAASWLLANDYELPDDLKDLEDSLCE